MRGWLDEEKRKRWTDMDPNVKWDLLFNMLNDMALMIKSLDALMREKLGVPIKESIVENERTIINHEGNKIKMGGGQ